ncbi:hypothetical protein F4821DRAFT_228508 [Hypoxylon rubiginosum]|uniref:Uncharacterized protein n=1 Tax=Hypoxylon rubiginosum TaxID=110542 RepID=A0ACC0DCS6_9PEZI|nr:hypothetical protein F4821DRAFT_228508 [Hypoxylon rubiginosum]
MAAARSHAFCYVTVLILGVAACHHPAILNIRPGFLPVDQLADQVVVHDAVKHSSASPFTDLFMRGSDPFLSACSLYCCWAATNFPVELYYRPSL